jgi:hypothetical protein
VPPEVDVVEALVVGEEDDLRCELGLGPVVRACRYLVEQPRPVLQPVLVHDHRAEVEVHLVAGLHEVVDRGDPVGDLRRAHVDQA